MKNILTIAFMLVCATISAQDTTGVMITLTNVAQLDYEDNLNETSTRRIRGRNSMFRDHSFKVGRNEVLALHLHDNVPDVYRTITTLWLDDNVRRDTTIQSTNSISYSPHGYGPMLVEVSHPVFRCVDCGHEKK